MAISLVFSHFQATRRRGQVYPTQHNSNGEVVSGSTANRHLIATIRLPHPYTTGYHGGVVAIVGVRLRARRAHGLCVLATNVSSLHAPSSRVYHLVSVMMRRRLRVVLPIRRYRARLLRFSHASVKAQGSIRHVFFPNGGNVFVTRVRDLYPVVGGNLGGQLASVTLSMQERFRPRVLRQGANVLFFASVRVSQYGRVLFRGGFGVVQVLSVGHSPMVRVLQVSPQRGKGYVYYVYHVRCRYLSGFAGRDYRPFF